MSIRRATSTRTSRTRRSAASRFHHTAPAQPRSRETLDRFVVAVEELLRDQPFEAISIQDIVRKAERPIGSFYARFGSKEALLPVLYHRYHVGLEPWVASRLDRYDWESLDFQSTVRAMVDLILALYDERHWLIRALALFARLHPEALPSDIVENRRRLFELLARILARHREHITHADPKAAARFGVFLIAAVVREKLLFGEAPHARVTLLNRKTLREELVRTLHGYLTNEASR
jgi:AcrR family transcriptional regulator